MRIERIALCAAVLSGLVFPGAIAAERARPEPKSPIDPVMDQLFAVRRYKEVSISPDGKRVAWVESLQEKTRSPLPLSAIYVADLGSFALQPRRVTGGAGGGARVEHDLAWSPDGARLAFLSDREKPGQVQLYVAAAAATIGRKLTNLTGALGSPSWSPDGKTIALLFTENSPRAAGPLEPATPDAGVVEERIFEQRLTTVDVASGRARQISPADLYVHEYDWSPDGRQIVATAAPGSGDNNWYIAQLHTIDVATGATRSILKPAMQIAAPRWSPDGTSIAFVGGLMSDEGATGGDIFVVPAGGGEARNLTPDMKASAGSIAWLVSSKQIVFSEYVDGESGVAAVDVESGEITTRWRGPEMISAGGGNDISLSLSRDATASAIIRASYGTPPEVWAGPIGSWTQITRANEGIRPAWGKAESLHWPSGRWTIQGWLIYPRHYNPGSRYPLLVSVHGGPASAVTPSWPGARFGLAVLSSLDYFVLLPNPRGSFGQGEKFTRGNVRDFGHGDLRDILAGVDAVVRKFPIDENRIGIGGYSYGGYMTMWAVTQTDRFHAAIAGAGVANWQSYYGQNGIDQWLIPYFGASVYDDPDVYARSSPINFIKNASTPTLIMVGDRDIECPTPQSYEFWHALTTLDVKTQLVIYPNEGHGIRLPDHRRDMLRRAAAWFDEHLK